MKPCRVCQQSLPLDTFALKHGRQANGQKYRYVDSQCKSCAASRKRDLSATRDYFKGRAELPGWLA